MRILVTNDDGYDAPGIHVLREIARGLSDDVWVVAPESNQSGKGHSLSLHEPLRLREIEPKVFAVRGTPTDCVLMAVRHVMRDSPPDLLLSGVNRGANIAEDVHYSGTIAAAIEGALIGVRSIALSQSFAFDASMPLWETPLEHAPALIRKLLGFDWGEGVLMNINFPDCTAGEVTATLATRQGRRDPGLVNIEGRKDTWGDAYYWLAYQRRPSVRVDDGSDLAALNSKAIAVTPLHVDMTHHATTQRINHALR
jgi:5'-nucleotidase